MKSSEIFFNPLLKWATVVNSGLYLCSGLDNQQWLSFFIYQAYERGLDMRALLGTLVLLGLVVLLWPAIASGLGAIIPWVIGIVVVVLILVGLGGSSDNKPKV